MFYLKDLNTNVHVLDIQASEGQQNFDYRLLCEYSICKGKAHFTKGNG
jgi:hypothetical protein